MNAVVGFHWTLLYPALVRLARGVSSWWEEWHQTLHNITTTHGFNTWEYCLLYNLYKSFQHASMDLVTLQGIDLLLSIACACAVPGFNLICDGVAVSCRLEDLHLEAPWLPRADSDDAPRTGSAYSDRTCLGQKQRELVWHFARTGGSWADKKALKAPLSEEEWDKLLSLNLPAPVLALIELAHITSIKV